MPSPKASESVACDEIATLLHDQFSRLARHLRALELPKGMTPERVSALAVIDNRGPISVTSLADTERVRPATMSRMVSALVDEGFAKRTENKQDGRGVLVSVTSKGKRSYQKAQQQRRQQLIAALSALSDDQLDAMRGLAAALDRLTLVLEQPRLN